MSRWRIFGVLLVVLSVGVPVDMFACGDKFLISGRGTRYQRPKNARAANVLIYADPASTMAATIKKEKVEPRLRLEGHRVAKAQTIQEVSTHLSTGGYDVILTTSRDSASVQSLNQGPDASVIVLVDLLKNQSLIEAIDNAVLQRDQTLKKTPKR